MSHTGATPTGTTSNPATATQSSAATVDRPFLFSLGQPLQAGYGLTKVRSERLETSLEFCVFKVSLTDGTWVGVAMLRHGQTPSELLLESIGRMIEQATSCAVQLMPARDGTLAYAKYRRSIAVWQNADAQPVTDPTRR